MRQRRLDQIGIILRCIEALTALSISPKLRLALAEELDSVHNELKASIIKLVPTKKEKL